MNISCPDQYSGRAEARRGAERGGAVGGRHGVRRWERPAARAGHGDPLGGVQPVPEGAGAAGHPHRPRPVAGDTRPPLAPLGPQHLQDGFHRPGRLADVRGQPLQHHPRPVQVEGVRRPQRPVLDPSGAVEEVQVRGGRPEEQLEAGGGGQDGGGRRQPGQEEEACDAGGGEGGAGQQHPRREPRQQEREQRAGAAVAVPPGAAHRQGAQGGDPLAGGGGGVQTE